MVDVDPTVGWMRVRAKGIIGGADSNDAGDAPDVLPMIGTAKIRANTKAPVYIVSTDEILALATIDCILDSAGRLTYVPTDTEVRLIAPQQLSIEPRDWTYTITFYPATGQPWASFSVVFWGEPGDTVNLGPLLQTQASAGVSVRPLYVVASWVNQTIPGAVAGDLVLDEGTGIIHKITVP